MLADYHIHTKMCGHAEGEMVEYVERAQSLGLKEIGFADHIPMYFLPKAERDPEIAMKEEELPVYIESVEELQKKFHPLSIKIGIEADFSPQHLPDLKSILNTYSFDYVLGSIHFLGGWGYDNPALIDEYEKRDIDEIYAEYFSLLEKTINSGMFDIIAHPDLVKKFNFRPRKDIKYIYERLAKAIYEAGICIEVNTAGLRVPAKEIYPAPEFLQECYKYRIPVTLGSDAHRPEQVGADLLKAKKLLQDVGYTEIALFEKRKRTMVTL